MIVSNTTLTRPSLKERVKSIEQGGLSGRPLFALSTRMLAETFVRVEGKFPLIGVGGVDSGEAALIKIKAGATLVQLYSGMVFKGSGLVRQIKRDLIRTLDRGRHKSLADFVGVKAASMTAEAWPD
jgi:dihydroorotate dehydrogenase